MSKESVTGLQFICKLVAFSFALSIIGCRENETPKKISIIWKDGRPTRVLMTGSFVNAIHPDSIHKKLFISLATNTRLTPIAGEFVKKESGIIFEPVIPFTRGLRYKILSGTATIDSFEIPLSGERPELLAIYPSQDTLPENLLKMYFTFSHPMAEGQSSKLIHLADINGDSLKNVFLDLQQELWNEDGTVLTLWLNPGRIKRHLQPNITEGVPIISGRKYKVVVSKNWPDKTGSRTRDSFIKEFVTTVRDTISPSPSAWKFHIPKKETLEHLVIELNESLDYTLLQNAVRVQGPENRPVQARLEINNEEKEIHFIPLKPWQAGSYKLKVERRLEDLAGNNLGRLFDVDLETPVRSKFPQHSYERVLRID